MPIRNCILMISACIPCTCLAEDWTQWRGDNRAGLWQATGLVDQLPDEQLELDWSVEIGPGYCGPTVADGRVFVMDRLTGNTDSERILCFNSQDGSLIWKHEYPAEYSIGYTAGPRASVTIDEQRAYAVGAMGHFHCLNAATGEVLWQRDLAKDYESEMPIWGIASAPLIYGRLVIQQVAGDEACMVAFDKATGKEAWRALDEKASYSSPIVIQQAGQDVLVCWTGESLSGLNPSTGEVHWRHSMPPSRMPIGIGTPIIDENLIFVSSFYDGSMMIRVDDNSLTSSLVWRAVGTDEQHTQALHAMIGTSILRDGYVYGVDSYGELRCLDALTGERIWEDQSAVPHARWATIHMVQQENRVWMFNERGEVLIGVLSPQGLTIIDRCPLIAPTRVQLNQRNGVCWAHPAFAEKSIFARSDDKLVRASLAK